MKNCARISRNMRKNELDAHVASMYIGDVIKVGTQLECHVGAHLL